MDSDKSMSNGTSIWFVCKFCRRAFVRRKYLVRHKREFHPKNGSELIQPAVVDQRGRSTTRESFTGNSDVHNEIEETSETSLQPSANPTRFDKKKKKKKTSSPVSRITKDDDKAINKKKSESSVYKMTTPEVDDEDSHLHRENKLKSSKNVTTTRDRSRRDSKGGAFPQCPACKRVLGNKRALQLHMRSHTRYDCSDCNDVFYNKALWLKHQGSHKNKKSGGFLSENENGSGRKVILKRKCNTASSHGFNFRPRKISKITETLPSSSEDNSSVSSSNENRFLECTYCKKKIRREYLKTHEKIHTGGYKCRYCQKGSATSTTRTIHERVHTGERPYKCTYCPKAFARPSHRIYHERAHTGERPYPCRFCNKRFSHPSSRNAHVKRIHE